MTVKGQSLFIDDYRFTGIYNDPKCSLRKYSQYKFLLTPDFSTYVEMNLWRQMESIAHSRWVGAYWQSKGLTVIPTVSWSTPRSFEFCFDGIEKGSVVAVGTLGCKKNKRNFMRGYNEMLERMEIAYHTEKSLTGDNHTPVLHYHTYDERFSKNATDAFTRSSAKLLSDEMKQKYKKFFRGIKL